MRTETHVEINCSPEGLWPLLTDPDELMKWNTDIVSNEIVHEVEGVGAISKVGVKEGSRTVEYECEVTAWEPNVYLEIELRGGSLGKNPMAVGYRLAPTASGTRLTFTAEWKPSGILLRLMVPLIRIVGNRNGRRVMGALKELAETSTA